MHEKTTKLILWKRTEFKSGSSCPQEQQFILPCCQNTFSKVSKLDFNDCMFSLTPKPLNCIWKFWRTDWLFNFSNEIYFFLTFKNDFVSHTQRLEKEKKKKLSNIKSFISMPNFTQKIYIWKICFYPTTSWHCNCFNLR